MTLTEKAIEYARTHLQAVRICWVNRHMETCSAEEAVSLCSGRPLSGRIVGVVAQDKALEDMLNQPLDSE